MHHSVKTWHRWGERSSWKADAPRPWFGSSAAVSRSLPSHPGAALGRLGVRVTNQPTWCWVRYSSTVRELPRGQCAWHSGLHRDQCRLLW